MVKDATERDRFIEQNLGLVHTICRRFSGKGIEYDDLYQAGCIGLVKAYDAFDQSRGLCFSTYAVPVIVGSVRRLFRDGGNLKVSRSVKELGIKINREKNKFQQECGVEPTVSQLAQILNVTKEEITEAVCATQPIASLTVECEDGVKEAELPTVGYEEEITSRLSIKQAIESLEETEKQIIEYRYFRYFTQSKTAEALNMTQVQISRSEKKILAKLRNMLK